MGKCTKYTIMITIIWISLISLSYFNLYRLQIHTLDYILNVHNYSIILFTFSNLWNMFVWKLLFMGMLDVSLPCLHLCPIVTSLWMYGAIPSREDLKLILSIKSRNNSVSDMVYIGCFNSADLNDHGRMQINHSLVAGVLVGYANTAPGAKPGSIPIQPCYHYNRNLYLEGSFIEASP